jgi:predicted GTPase
MSRSEESVCLLRTNVRVSHRVPPCLLQMSVVDTPGTNVILERQQRLTEEFVPRADLVLFVLSADRALTESEVSRGSRCGCQQ